MFRKTKITLVLAGGSAAAMLAMGAGVASASPVPVQKTFSSNVAGYSTIFTGNFAFNDVRTDVTAPAEPNLVPADHIADGIVLQESASGPSSTAGMGLVWNDNVLGHVPAGSVTSFNTNASCIEPDGTIIHPSTTDPQPNEDQYTVESAFAASIPPGQPIPPNNLLPIPFKSGTSDGTMVYCVPAGTSRYYIEIHDSTLFNCIGWDAGSIEPGDNITPVQGSGQRCVSLESFFGPGARFSEAGVGVDTTDGAAASDLTPGTLANFWRNGLTQLLHPTQTASTTNGRETLDQWQMREYLGTTTGTSSGAATLTPSGLGVGSTFFVTANT